MVTFSAEGAIQDPGEMVTVLVIDNNLPGINGLAKPYPEDGEEEDLINHFPPADPRARPSFPELVDAIQAWLATETAERTSFYTAAGRRADPLATRSSKSKRRWPWFYHARKSQHCSQAKEVYGGESCRAGGDAHGLVAPDHQAAPQAPNQDRPSLQSDECFQSREHFFGHGFR